MDNIKFTHPVVMINNDSIPTASTQLKCLLYTYIIWLRVSAKTGHCQVMQNTKQTQKDLFNTILNQHEVSFYNEGITFRGLYNDTDLVMERYVGVISREILYIQISYVEFLQSINMTMKNILECIQIKVILYSWMESSYGFLCLSSLQIVKHDLRVR